MNFQAGGDRSYRREGLTRLVFASQDRPDRCELHLLDERRATLQPEIKQCHKLNVTRLQGSVNVPL